ncbi:hypothetical protein CQW23_17651 [Capsicum baccatum]|uniref:F-box associated domain-containing protein n=1 Tax=Capsicum baccatum TaxID=33114 RepID=A0A2G2WED5_CAPBA|nr:hypothetical protein CQW23_17651 [Capsicum baccatum]
MSLQQMSTKLSYHLSEVCQVLLGNPEDFLHFKILTVKLDEELSVEELSWRDLLNRTEYSGTYHQPIHINGFVFWLLYAEDNSNIYFETGNSSDRMDILEMNLENEEIKTICCPNGCSFGYSHLAEINGHICVIQNNRDGHMLNIWMLKDRDGEGWCLEYSVEFHETAYNFSILGYLPRENESSGDILIKSSKGELFCYETDTKEFKELEILNRVEYKLKCLSKEWLHTISSPHFKKQHRDQSKKRPTLYLISSSRSNHSFRSQLIRLSSVNSSYELQVHEKNMDLQSHNQNDSIFAISFGKACFVYVPSTNEYKVVGSFEGKLDSADWEFYYCFDEFLRFKNLTLKLDEELSVVGLSWRDLLSCTHHSGTCHQPIHINGLIFWLAYAKGNSFTSDHMTILEMNLENEEMKTICCPNGYSFGFSRWLR